LQSGGGGALRAGSEDAVWIEDHALEPKEDIVLLLDSCLERFLKMAVRPIIRQPFEFRWDSSAGGFLLSLRNGVSIRARFRTG